jgi:hypothetical protein
MYGVEGQAMCGGVCMEGQALCGGVCVEGQAMCGGAGYAWRGRLYVEGRMIKLVLFSVVTLYTSL